MKRGEIYLYNNKNADGFIQSKIRPVIIVQNNIGNFYSPTTIVCPISGKIDKELPTHCLIENSGGLKYDKSIVLCEQLVTVNKADLKWYIGTITDTCTLNRLNKCLKISLGMEEEQ